MGLGYDTGAQGALASVGTSEGLTGTNVRVGGKDVTARGMLIGFRTLLTYSVHVCSISTCSACMPAWHDKPKDAQLSCFTAWVMC